MKTIKRDYLVYNYQELNGKAKDKAKEKMEELITASRFDTLSSDLTEELFYKYGINGRIWYSLSYSQGDGLCFDTDELLTSPFIESLSGELVKKGIPEVTIQSILKLIKDKKIQAITNNGDYRYAYASKHQVTISYEGYEEDYRRLSVEDIESLKLNAKKPEDIVFFFRILEESIQEVYLSIAYELEKIGYSVYKVDEEDILEECLINDIVFLENGSIFNE
jgi:hypothetical protein